MGAVIYGNSVGVTGLPYENARSLRRNAPEKRTVIDANSKTTVLFNFVANESLEDSLISFSLNMARQHESKADAFSQFTIGIANIKVN